MAAKFLCSLVKHVLLSVLSLTEYFFLKKFWDCTDWCSNARVLPSRLNRLHICLETFCDDLYNCAVSCELWMLPFSSLVTRKYDCGLTSLLHDELHWLDVSQQVQYKLCATVHCCRQHKASQCMTDCCSHTSDIARRQHLQSAGCCRLFVPQHRRLMFGCQAFSVDVPVA